MRLTAKKIALLKRNAEHAQSLREMGAVGNIRWVFVAPKDLLELLRKYPSI
jgi:hypothetical protein